jgi:FkbM family methyltransferase
LRKIFIDCGSYDGCSVRKFNDLYDKGNEYEYYCFEGNPNLFIWHPVNDRCVFHRNIVYDSNESVDFFIHDVSGGSTVNEKTHQKYLNKYQIPSRIVKYNPIVLSSFIDRNFKKEDFIVLKLDIEGAEFKVLKDLIEKKHIEYINKIFIEWHCKNEADQKSAETWIKSFNEKCKSLGIEIDSTWDAMHPPYMKQIRV